MGIHIGIAVAWKMLSAGPDILTLNAVDESGAASADRVGHGAEGAATNHRIVWVGVNVHHRSKVHIDAQ